MTKPVHDPELQREVATAVVSRLRASGHEAYFVGGCVREMLLGRRPADYDVTTDAVPERIAELFARTVHVGAKFGVVTVIEREVHVEVATFRTETGYADGRRPDSVAFSTALEDVSRRDLTINALLHDPMDGRIIDHVGGQQDLRDGVIRTVGDPLVRFAEDHLRLLRAVRFTARLGFRLEPATAEAIRQLAGSIVLIAPERIREELGRMLADASRGAAFRLLDDVGLLAHVLPEVAALHGVPQPPEHHPEGDVFVHTMLALDALPAETSEAAAWATLLHDVGKPSTITHVDRIRFHGHETVGAAMAERILTRLRASSALRDRVTALVQRHLQPRDAPRMKASTLRRLLADPLLDDLLVVARADATAGSGRVDHVDFIEEARVERGSMLPPPLVTGRDLIAAGLPPGPAFARVLRRLHDEQLEGRLANRDEALARLRELVTDEASGP